MDNGTTSGSSSSGGGVILNDPVLRELTLHGGLRVGFGAREYLAGCTRLRPRCRCWSLTSGSCPTRTNRSCPRADEPFPPTPTWSCPQRG
jgi:hypothetical protein